MKKSIIKIFMAVLCVLCTLFTSTVSGAYKANASTESTGGLTGTFNILVIGSDRRNGSWNGNSDTMLLITINHDARKIFMVSFMRDLYVNVPGHGGRRLNSAYALGGAGLLIDTLQSNFGVRIDRYVASDFGTTANIIDSLGGVDLTLSAEEAQIVGVAPGAVHLNGQQAVAYARIRKVGYYDFERTERQRRILINLYHRVDKSNPAAVLSLLNNVLGSVSHNLSGADLLSLAMMMPVVSTYSFVTDRVPYDGTFSVSADYMLVPNNIADIAAIVTGEIYEGASGGIGILTPPDETGNENETQGQDPEENPDKEADKEDGSDLPKERSEIAEVLKELIETIRGKDPAAAVKNEDPEKTAESIDRDQETDTVTETEVKAFSIAEWFKRFLVVFAKLLNLLFSYERV